MKKIFLIALFASFIPFATAHADIESMQRISPVCAKLVSFEALKKRNFSSCVKAEKNAEFQRKACNRRPDQGFCRVVFQNQPEEKMLISN